MTTVLRFVLAPVALCLLVLLSSVVAAQPPAAVSFVVLREHGVGSASQAQPHVDKLMQRIGTLTGWTAKGKYLRSRSAAREFVHDSQAEFGLMTLAAFLDLRGEYGLDVLGSVDVAAAGGRRYHLISTTAATIDACRGKPLASDHLDDARFIDRVVAANAFSLGQFELRPTKRPMQTLKAAIRGEATCALIDDAQLAAAPKVEGGSGLTTVWSSAELPPMVLVALRTATAERRKKLAGQIGQICQGPGRSVCEAAGISALRPASAKTYAKIVSAYGEG